MKAKNQHLTPHTLKRVKELEIFLSERTAFTRLDIMAECMDCSSRQIRRYLSILKDIFGIHFIQKSQGFKLISNNKEVSNILEVPTIEFAVFNQSVFFKYC